MSSHRLEISDDADTDLQTIGRYTERNYGTEQRDKYELALRSALQAIEDYPEIGEACPWYFPGARSFVVEKHIIFYRLEPGIISVVRVLHHRQDRKKAFRRWNSRR